MTRTLRELVAGLLVFTGTVLGVPVLLWALLLAPFAT